MVELTDVLGMLVEFIVETLVELIVEMIVELTPVADETKGVEKAVELAEGVGENETIDTEMPLGAETVTGAEHCDETTLSPQ